MVFFSQFLAAADDDGLILKGRKETGVSISLLENGKARVKHM